VGDIIEFKENQKIQLFLTRQAVCYLDALMILSIWADDLLQLEANAACRELL